MVTEVALTTNILKELWTYRLVKGKPIKRWGRKDTDLRHYCYDGWSTEGR